MRRLRFGFKLFIAVVVVVFVLATTKILQRTPSPSDPIAPATPIEPEEIAPADFADMGYLVLVNRDHAVSAADYQDFLARAWPTLPVSSIYDVYLHETALKAIAEMFDSARADGISGLFVSSGFRSYEHQRELYENPANQGFALPPGHSEHHTGLAADILIAGIGMHEMADTPEGRWLAENSYRYGLILRYPQGAKQITGIEFEPWHFRYVGREAARYMFENGLALEEYLELVR